MTSIKGNKMINSMNKKFNVSCLFFGSLVIMLASSSYAFKNKSISVGIGYLSENFMNKTATKSDGSAGFLGETNYNLNLKYDYSLSSDWFLAPQLSYTPMPRSSPGNTAKVSLLHLVFQIGQNYSSSGSSGWDWYFGPGILQRQIKGTGGTVQMNNGTGTATFAIPGRSSTVQKVTSNFGSSYNFENSRIGIDLVFESFFSNTKRTQSLMLSYAYQFSGGY